MDHAAAREHLELAAVEPGGLDRLMAGDTPDAAAVAGHLAGCPACTEELGRLHASALLVRDAVASAPPPELRRRTLAYVAALGRDRRPPAPPDTASLAEAPIAHPEAPAVTGARRPSAPSGGPALLVAALAAAILVAVAGTLLVTDARHAAEIARQDAELERRADVVAALERVTAASLRITAEPDAVHVALAGPGTTAGQGARGTLTFSPRTRELVVVASGLRRPPEGRELRCWFERDGVRRPVGRMYFAQDLAFWVGPVDEVAEVAPGARFGVTLVDAGGALDGAPILVGEL